MSSSEFLRKSRRHKYTEERLQGTAGVLFVQIGRKRTGFPGNEMAALCKITKGLSPFEGQPRPATAMAGGAMTSITGECEKGLYTGEK